METVSEELVKYVRLCDGQADGKIFGINGKSEIKNKLLNS